MRFADFVLGEITDPISSGDTTIRVTHSQPYNRFPDPDGDTARAVISDSLEAPTVFEVITYTGIVDVDSNTTDLTGVSRGAGGTSPESFSDGAVIRQDVTADDLQLLELQDQVIYSYGCSSDTTIRKLRPDGTEEWVFSGHDNSIVGLAVGFDGAVYSASADTESNSGEVKKVSPDGTEVWSKTTSYIPNILAFGEDGFIYVGSRAPDRSGYKIDPSDGSDVWVFAPGSASQANVVGIAANRDGLVCQAQTHGEVYLVFPDGGLMRRLPVIGGNAGAANRGGIKITPDGSFLMCGGGNEEFIEKAHPDGSVETLFSSGSSPGYDLVALAVHPGNGDIYVSQIDDVSGDQSIRKFDDRGGEITDGLWPISFSQEGVYELAIGLDGNLYAAGTDPSRVYKFDGETGDDLGATTFFAAVRRVDVTRLTKDMVAKYESGEFGLGFVEFNHVSEKPTSNASVAFEGISEGDDPYNAPSGKCVIVFDGTNLIARFDDFSEVTIASK